MVWRLGVPLRALQAEVGLKEVIGRRTTPLTERNATALHIHDSLVAPVPAQVCQCDNAFVAPCILHNADWCYGGAVSGHNWPPFLFLHNGGVTGVTVCTACTMGGPALQSAAGSRYARYQAAKARCTRCHRCAPPADQTQVGGHRCDTDSEGDSGDQAPSGLGTRLLG